MKVSSGKLSLEPANRMTYIYYCTGCDKEKEIKHMTKECDTVKFECKTCGAECRRSLQATPHTFLELGVNY